METSDKYQNIRSQGMQAFAQSDFIESIAKFTRFLEHDPDDAVIRLSRGAAHMKLEHFNDAEADFSAVVRRDPGNARALHLRGLVREMQGDNENALNDLGKAIEHAPAYGAAYLSRSHVLAKMGRDEEALEDRQMVIRITSANIEEFNNDNNVWHSHHMTLEADMESELIR